MPHNIPFPKSTTNARSMPELRAALIEQAVPNGIWSQAEFQRLLIDLTGSTDGPQRMPNGNIVIQGPNGIAPEDMNDKLTMCSAQADNNIRWYRENLPMAQLIHVNEQMTDFIVAAAEAAPSDMKLYLHDAPSPAGLVVFAKPVMGTDAGPDNAGGPVTH